MAALVLSAAGAAAGGAVFGPVGAIAGRLVGALAGNVIDHALFGRHDQPRRSKARGWPTSTSWPRPKARRSRASMAACASAGPGDLGDQLRRGRVDRTDTTGGGKGVGGGGSSTTTTTYTYFANFAVGLCEGPMRHVQRVWADGNAARPHRHHCAHL